MGFWDAIDWPDISGSAPFWKDIKSTIEVRSANSRGEEINVNHLSRQDEKKLRQAGIEIYGKSVDYFTANISFYVKAEDAEKARRILEL